MSSWDSTRAKAQFRLTAQRLGQLRDRMDAQGQVVGRDISILLQQNNIMLARAKAQKLIQEEIVGDLLENLEMQIGVLVEHFAELDGKAPSPVTVEAASSIIYATPYVESKEIQTVRDLLGFRLGSDFLRSATTNRDHYVSPKILRAVSAPPASAADLDTYLVGIARSYGVNWAPDLRPDDVLHALSEILDRTNDTPVVDLPRLRRVCANGIPHSPSWLRPRVWKVLLGILPVLKASWDKEARKSRDNYYDLVRRLLEPFSDLPPPTDPLAPIDASLTGAIKDLFRVPANLFAGLEEEPDSSYVSPLDDSAPDEVRIHCAANLDIRLQAIHGQDAGDAASQPPDITLELDSQPAPSISVTSPDSDTSHPPATLHSSRNFSTGGAHPKHASALIRLLYIHACLNPANHSPHMASLLIPLYSVLIQEIEPQDLAHVEADTFWLFEAMVGEFAELEDEEGGNQWMQRLGDRLQWADSDLAIDLHAKGLSPSLPHYSYRWLAPLLTHTLPLTSVLSIWDSLFARPMTTRDASPKLDYLLDICTSMLIRARGPLLRLGKSGRRSPGLWGDDGTYREPPSPIRAWELNDAFIEGMALLQMYPIEAAGGVERILQTASELAQRREQEAKSQKPDPGTLGARIRNTVWRGFTNQRVSPAESSDSSSSEEESVDEESQETEAPHQRTPPIEPTGLGSRLANVVWKGITNQSAMDDVPSTPPLSPFPPNSPFHPSTPGRSQTETAPEKATSPSIWGYAGKLRDSDAAATLAKVSTNWRVKAIQAWNTGGKADQLSPQSASNLASKPRSGSFSQGGSEKTVDEGRRGSLPPIDRRDVYSPPARPAFFRPPRDSMLPQPRRSPLSSPTNLDVIADTSLSAPSARSIRESIASIAALAGPVKSTPKSGPRPLLLSSSNLMTGAAPPSRAASRSPGPGHIQDWANISRPHSRQNSVQSSISSVSEIAGRSRRSDRNSDWDSDATESRVVSLKRGSVSPMALASRHGRLASQSSSSDRSVTDTRPMHQQVGVSPTSQPAPIHRGWALADVPDSPMTVPSSPPPHTPPSPASNGNEVTVQVDSRHGSIVFNESSVRVLEPPAQARKLSRKKTPPPTRIDYTSDSSAPVDMPSPTRSPRVKTKRDGTIRAPRSPNTLALPQWADEHDAGSTPRAAVFPVQGGDGESSASPVSPRSPRRARKVSAEGNGEGHGPPRIRKLSTEARRENRARKLSTEAEEGDDEGYDDLLSAYESEDSMTPYDRH
ncbi:regulator of Vps4 activity in the MVB pathway-domain-containing protein [Amylostereum chailletii]|nr:regulator of Vps4 activity in the MVB pathway-domain-containing protein [Amylostereum chailletii]